MNTDILFLAFVVLNIVAFLMYGYDKYKAKADKWRTPEKTLLGIALLAPWGSILGMNIFHHKTRKTKFKLVYLFALIHIVVFVVYINVY